MDKNGQHGFVSTWFLALLLVVITVIALGGVGRFTKLYNVIFERQVFEQSYQYSEARNSEIAIYEAELASLESQLQSEGLTDSQVSNIEGQIRVINIRLNASQSELGD